MTEEERAVVLAMAIFKAECGQLPNSIIFHMQMWHDRVANAHRILEINDELTARMEATA